MEKIGGKIGKEMISSKANSLKKQLGGNQSKIEWNDFNYPPVLKIIHFSLSELNDQPAKKTAVTWLWMTHVGIFIVSIINLISNIVQGVDNSGDGIRILYSILYMIIFNPIQCFWFYRGYRGLIDEPGWLKLFRLSGFILIAFYCIQSIIHPLNFDGFIRVGKIIDE